MVLRQGAILESTDAPSLVISAELGYIVVYFVPYLRAVSLLAREEVSDGGSNRHRCVS